MYEEELERYSELGMGEQKALETFWDPIVEFLSTNEADWINMSDFRTGVESDSWRLELAFKAMIQVYDLEESTGENYPFYELEMDYVKDVGRELGFEDESVDLGESGSRLVGYDDYYR